MMFLTCCLHFLSRALNRFSLSFFVLYIIEVPMFLAEKQVNPPRKNDNGFLHEVCAPLSLCALLPPSPRENCLA